MLISTEIQSLTMNITCWYLFPLKGLTILQLTVILQAILHILHKIWCEEHAVTSLSLINNCGRSKLSSKVYIKVRHITSYIRNKWNHSVSYTQSWRVAVQNKVWCSWTTVYGRDIIWREKNKIYEINNILWKIKQRLSSKFP